MAAKTIAPRAEKIAVNHPKILPPVSREKQPQQFPTLGIVIPILILSKRTLYFTIKQCIMSKMRLEQLIKYFWITLEFFMLILSRIAAQIECTTLYLVIKFFNTILNHISLNRILQVLNE